MMTLNAAAQPQPAAARDVLYRAAGPFGFALIVAMFLSFTAD
jgi:hypothetical protein